MSKQRSSRSFLNHIGLVVIIGGLLLSVAGVVASASGSFGGSLSSFLGLASIGGASEPAFLAPKPLGPSRPDKDDRQLADRLKKLTDRSSSGLTEQRKADGTVSVDIKDIFQHVALARQLEDGELATACVASLAEAEAFLGRKLETGEPVDSSAFQRTKRDAEAALHGMTRPEYEYYLRLIEDAAERRRQNPAAATISIVNLDGEVGRAHV